MSSPSKPAAAGKQPGAPTGKDEIDPELVSLRGPRARVGAVTALAIVAVCVCYMIRLLPDFSFAGASAKPRDVKLDDVVAGRVATDDNIRLTASIERAAAARVRTGPGDPGLRLAPVVGSDDKLWVAVPGDGWTKPRVADHYAGRLRTLAGPLGDGLRDYMKRPMPRFVTGAELRKARLASADGGTLAAIAGPAVTATAATQVEIEVADPGAAVVVVTYDEKLKDAEAWATALAAADVIAPGAAPATTGEDHAAWKIRTPDAVHSAEQKLAAAQLWASRVEPVTARTKAAWRDLAAGPDGIQLAEGRTLPWSAVDVAAVWAPRPVPDGARVILGDEAPADFWLVRPLYAVLAVLALLFVWALWRAVRRDFWPLPKVG
jgi:hypothetical protein